MDNLKDFNKTCEELAENFSFLGIKGVITVHATEIVKSQFTGERYAVEVQVMEEVIDKIAEELGKEVHKLKRSYGDMYDKKFVIGGKNVVYFALCDRYAIDGGEEHDI